MQDTPIDLPYAKMISYDMDRPFKVDVYFTRSDGGKYVREDSNYETRTILRREIMPIDVLKIGYLWSSSENLNQLEIIDAQCPMNIDWQIFYEDRDYNLGARLWGRILKIATYLLLDPFSIKSSDYVVSYGIPQGPEASDMRHAAPRLLRPEVVTMDYVQRGVQYCYYMHRL